ncbi:septum formation initiator family protein [Emcibacteraceae bacterium]|nr:septum formation initiator family protein [Emcibacteraceae bacterium]
MKNKKSVFTRLRGVTAPLLALLVIFYFGAYAIKGLATKDMLSDDITSLELRHDSLKSQRKILEFHVGLLSSNHVDPDYLDELVRKNLGFSHPDEIIIPR